MLLEHIKLKIEVPDKRRNALNDAFLDQDYVLEVSTPGIDRKFFKAEQLSAFLKEEFDLRLREIKNGKKNIDSKNLKILKKYFLIYLNQD